MAPILKVACFNGFTRIQNSGTILGDLWRVPRAALRFQLPLDWLSHDGSMPKLRIEESTPQAFRGHDCMHLRGPARLSS